LLFLISFIAGTFLGSFWFGRETFLAVGLILGIITLIVSWPNKEARIFILAFLFFLWGWQNISRALSKIPQEISNESFSEEVLVVGEPEKKDDYQKVIVKSQSLGKILFYAEAFSEVHYGDKLQLEGQLEFPENRDKTFDYQKYLAKDKIYYIAKKTNWKKVGEEGNVILQNIFKFKNKIEQIIDRQIIFPESELLSGLLLGKSGSFPEKLKEDFSRTGLTHIVAVSGYNITIIANYLMLLGILLGLWRKQAFYLAVLGIIFFIILIGFPASAVRAGVMGSLVLWAMKNGRLGNSQNALLLAAALMLFKNPMLLRFDVGFQLSFLATLGIVYLYPIFQNYFIQKEKNLGFLGETIFLTLSAQIFVLPIIVYNFGSLSIISLLANLLILPIVPLAMLLGFLLIVFSWMPILSQVLAWLAFLPLVYETKIASLLADIPWASVKVSFPVWGVAVWYVVLSWFIIKKN